MRGDKAKQIREALAEWGHVMGDKEIAEYVGATQSFVYKLRNKDKVKKRIVSKKAKAQAIAKNNELGKNVVRRGRPPKVKSVAEVAVIKKPVTIAEACHTLIDVLQQHKNLYLSFDTSRTAVEVMWNDDVYHVAPEEVTRIAECVDYLESRRLTYSLV